MFSQRNANDFKSKAKTNVERKLNFAKLYFMYKDYDAALQHVYEYLKYKENSAVGHKLLAQIYEAISEGDKALKSYQKSLECDTNQEDVLVQICKLLTVYPSDTETMRVSNYSYYMTPLSERFTSPKRTTRIHNGSNDGTDEKLALIVKRQEELLKNVCDQQELLLKSNEAILTAIKEGNNNFLNVQLKLDKINTTLEEIYLLKNLSFTKKQQYSQESVDISYNVQDEYNTTFSQIQNVGNETSNSTNWSKPQDGKGFAVKFKNCDISQEFQKAIHGAKGFQENTANNMQSYNDWPPANTPEENVIAEPEKPFDLRNQLSKHSNVTYGIHSNNEFFSQKDASESIYPETLFTSTTKDNNVENVGFTTSTSTANSDSRPLSELFKGQNKWQCEACYVQNDASTNCCLACEQPRPGFSNAAAVSIQDISFKFGIPAASTPANPVSNTSETFKFGHSPKIGNSFGFTFGNNTNQELTNSPSKPFSFTTALKEAQQQPFHFGSSQDFSFKFGGVSNSPVSTKSPKHQDVPNSPDEYHESSENSADDSFHFKPLIPLPPKVDVKTGEENETIVFNERAKLYRYVNGEWKERGIGDIKILRDISSNRYRLLMRRDQVLKVCLNHQISADLHLVPKGNDEGGVKSFQWSAIDYSDSTASSEVFAIRFKNSAIAEMFRKTIEESKTLISDVVINKVDTDLEIIYEKKPTSQEVLQKVDQLQLPLNFYNYENAVPCIGCRGCSDFIPKLMYEVNVVNPIENSDADTVGADTSSKHKSSEYDNSFVNSESNEGTDFKPVIPLPDLVEVKTGEEDEVVFFCQRAKLYRYDVQTKQWKERGVGEFKILKHISKQRYRLLLRRDQVLKIACNHYICKDLQFAPMPNSENAVCWYAIDYSEEVATTENFAVKFKVGFCF
ncbi:hypothetical protein B4U80_02256 [Leptotrombidium deliense]|uniref:E3 SUMO-protein ligase RanBP2-like protein n=1 Tax=Leptotrombidium deliense TaxID=299467 RepID=A0A443SVM4_9ACAR|nr:hypothetical protein B4U80_02256 [Leptotrombidium deliense]